MRRPWLLPFAPAYWVITSVRNSLFDLGILKSRRFDVPIICVGNLSAGGTGKTPHVEWIVRQFSEKYRIAVLSRGYGRKTRGFLMSTDQSTAADIGDEPLQIAQQFPGVTVAVCEDRVFGVETLLSQSKPPHLIVLDDAFQHRYISAGLYWLLTPWDDLYTRDHILPAGNLREDTRGADRADMITVTKCPGKPSPSERESVRRELGPTEIQLLTFSRMKYEKLISKDGQSSEKPSSALLVTGIANPDPLRKHLSDSGIRLGSLEFSDHREFTHADVQRILNAFESGSYECIITTRKDYVRWPGDKDLNRIPTLIQDIRIEMDDDDGIVYRTIDRFVSDFSQ